MTREGDIISGPLRDANEYRWSLDGTRLTFTDDTEAEPGHHLFVTDANGSAPIQLTEGPESDQAPAWSPDGARLVFQRSPSESPGSMLFTIDAEGGGLTPLTPGAMPSWAPDGSRIAFLVGSGSAPGVWTISPDGTAAQRISTARCTAKPPAWSPDGNYVLCIGPSLTGITLPWFLYRVKSDGSETINLTPQGVDPTVYSWSQGGTRILYDDAGANGSDIYLMDADGSNATNLTTDPQFSLQPFWIFAP